MAQNGPRIRTFAFTAIFFWVFQCLFVNVYSSGHLGKEATTPPRKHGKHHLPKVSSKHKVSRHLRPQSMEEALYYSFKMILAVAEGPGKSAYLGCFSPYKRKWNSRTHNATQALMTMDISGCLRHCWSQRYRISLVKAEDCHCSNVVKNLQKSKAHMCNRPCYGNEEISCGGSNGSFYDIYYTGYVSEPDFENIDYEDIPKVYHGCFKDRTQQLCRVSFTTLRLSVNMCIAMCEDAGFLFAVLASPKKCCCAQKLGKLKKIQDKFCSNWCEKSRGAKERCGSGVSRKAVYRTGVPMIIKGRKPDISGRAWMALGIDTEDFNRIK